PKEEFKDYYSLLEIEVESDERTINKAYRLLAKKYHPDKNKGNKNATELFKLIKEAKEILLDPAKRTIYDRKHKAMLMKKAGKEKMDKRQRDLTESLFAREDAAKRRRQGELTEEERRRLRISQIHQENAMIIEALIREREHSVHTELHPLDVNKDFERSADYGVRTMERLRKAAEQQLQNRSTV
ncbi:hypothetical protein WA171_004567, partial [Blastocystis sp. BT1]